MAKLKEPEHVISVKCNGSPCKLGFVGKDLVMLTHDMKTQQAIIDLGGEPCRCMQMVTAWRLGVQGDGNFFSTSAWGLRLNQAKYVHRQRAPHGGFCAFKSMSPWRWTYIQNSIETAQGVIENLNYRRAKSRWAGGDHVIRVSVGEMCAIGSSDYVKSNNRKWSGANSVIYVQIPAKWKRDVFDRGLAVIDNHFIMKVESEGRPMRVLAGVPIDTPDQLQVVALKQTRGFDVMLHYAMVRMEDNKNLTLKWQAPLASYKYHRKPANSLTGGNGKLII